MVASHRKTDGLLGLQSSSSEEEGEWGGGEEEVFTLGLDDDSEEENDMDDEEEDEEHDVEETVPTPVHKSKKSSKTKKHPEPEPSSSNDESDEFESWGREKSNYYNSNAALIASDEDEEEANEMEEREARRLQSRIRDSMIDEDYGLEDPSNLNVNVSVVPQDTEEATEPIEPLDKATTVRHLEKTSPETLALARDWDGVAQDLVCMQPKLDKLEATMADAMCLGLSHLHHQTLFTYVTTLAFYFHVRASPVTMTQPLNQRNSRVKQVLERLLILKQALSTLEELSFDASPTEDDESVYSGLDEEDKAQLRRLFAPLSESILRKEAMGKTPSRPMEKLISSELTALLEEADEASGKHIKPPVTADTPKKIRAQSGKPKISKGSLKRKDHPAKPTFDLVEPEFMLSKRPASHPSFDDLEAYGDATSLSMADDADKKARKRSLRFHTSKLEGLARKRENNREKLGGDVDIPYRERKKEKEARVRREVEKTRAQTGDDLDVDGDDDTELEGATARAKRKRDNAGDEDEDGYYELVKKAKKEREEEKKRKYDEARLADRVFAEDEGVSGPRSLSRAILKNKGLTPRRPKAVRNPRVKKRQRFEKAKKKMKSQKAVYKGGLSGKPYGGEETGISKVVKSVKLS